MLAAELNILDVRDSIENLLGLEGIWSGQEYRVLCPDPKHADRRPSCNVNLGTGIFHCFSCGAAGDYVRLAALVWGSTYEEARLRLEPQTMEALATACQVKLRKFESRLARVRIAPMRPLEDRYPDGPLTYLLNRPFGDGSGRLSPETLREWGIKFAPSAVIPGSRGDFQIFSNIGIPIRDDTGRLLSWCYRKTPQSPTWQPRYLYSHPVGSLWFGAERYGDRSSIVIVEGALDAIWLSQLGIEAIALLGADMVAKKAPWLRRYESVTILPDRDAGGLLAVQKLGAALAGRVPLKIARYPSRVTAKDPAELDDRAARRMISRAIPWDLWRWKNRTEATAPDHGGIRRVDTRSA